MTDVSELTFHSLAFSSQHHLEPSDGSGLSVEKGRMNLTGQSDNCCSQQVRLNIQVSICKARHCSSRYIIARTAGADDGDLWTIILSRL